MQKDAYAIKDYTSCFTQSMPSFLKCSRLSPLIEEYKPHFPHYQYDHPVDSLHCFHETFASGSHRRKSAPSKVPNDIDTKDPKSQVESSNKDKHFISSPLPLLYHLPPLSTYNAKMIELSNMGLQYYRTMDPFWLNPLKQESLRTNVMWPPGPLYLHPSYPVFHKHYPETMFPFQVPTQSLHMCHSLDTGLPDKDAINITQTDESEDSKQKVERVDVNIQIDESFYVEVGDQKRWKCPMCEKSYTSKYNLVTHILGHSGIKPHACARCGKLFKQLSHLHTHMLTHQGTRPHKCRVCNKAFTQTSHLKRHMMQHSDVKPYNCRICGRGFAYPSELKVHEAKHENGRENICVECGLDFPTLVQLKRHLTVHRGPVQYNCTECDKTFQYPSQLQNHMMKHKDIRPYICSECGMEFVQPHHLKQHSLTHKGVKEHKCGICGREFTLLANMKRHILIHTNIRAYQCHLCFKSFVQKQTLKAHMIVHSDIKPFKCKLCGKEFNRMHNLMGHMHLHSDSKPFKCLYCPSKFTLKGNLTRHMKVKHGVTERGYYSRGLSRGRAGLSHSIVLRSVEQKEPFDLSRKRRVKETSHSSDKERIKGSYLQEEEDENRSSIPTMYKEDVDCESDHGFEEHHNVMKMKCNKEKYNLHTERDAERTSHHHKEEEEEAFTDQYEGTMGLSVPDYLYFKNRNISQNKLQVH
ncbi:PREDICTED: zinc finger protein 366 [Nanorana parkeri]|uniref:zinc finger protein 366 n=1 Tax=Nanorana parkeri TaxID=125878 RepID=UPI000854E7A2|nr:PREDICTED: zinc finger protein 366 [Nanorana parkeri]